MMMNDDRYFFNNINYIITVVPGIVFVCFVCLFFFFFSFFFQKKKGSFVHSFTVSILILL